jgi:murein DD-endopeptidase MepM/ murein hydrolase activator NlpD
MRRTSVVLAVLAALALALAVPATGARTFRIVTSEAASLPSYIVPNREGSLVTPNPLGRPPAVPPVRSYEELLALWHRAGAAYGVPWEILAAINKIESNFGQNMGPSSAGALGWMQFIPSSWDRWGMDGDGDGIADPWNPEDGVYAAARYLAAAGAHEDLSRAIFAYNHAQWYVDDVLRLASLFRESDSGFSDFPFPAASDDVFLAADLEARVAAARRDVTHTRQALPKAERKIEKLGWRRLALEQRAGDLNLSDREFAAVEKQIAALERAEAKAETELERMRSELDEAVAAVQTLRDELSAAEVSSPTAAVLAGSGTGGYVFPVGGGPEVVSVGRDHHDYPAADIAAPEGSPLYALAKSVVLDVYPEPTGRCGIGFKLQIDGGAAYVYCHLAYLEPGVVPGAALAAGAPVGLVGSTGNSTGPHLHLQFSPALSYPQQEAWFESFAGTAFRWQGEPTRTRVRRPAPRKKSGPVFRIVQAPTVSVDERVMTFTP